MVLSNTLLLSYQIEYQTTDITISELCEKYNISTKQLKGYTKWTKEVQHIVPDNILVPELVESPQPIINIEQPSTTLPSSTSSNTEEPTDKETKLREDIIDFKVKAMTACKTFMENDMEFAEVKEFKDIVSIVDSIEKSISDKKSEAETPQILVQINNIMSKYA